MIGKSDALTLALEFASRGFGVFPCVGKRPAIDGGFHAATTDADAIRTWFRERPDANYGVTPPEGLWVLDVDRKDGGPATLERLVREHGELPPTLTIRSGDGGLHLWFRTGDAPMRQFQKRRDLPGIDTRVHGKGYVVGPGSIHPDTDRRYVVETDAPVPVAPAWLLELVKPVAPTPRAAPVSIPLPTTSGTIAEKRLHGELAAYCTEIAGLTGKGMGGYTVLGERAKTLGGRLTAHGLTALQEHVELSLIDAAGDAAGRWKADSYVRGAVRVGMSLPFPYEERPDPRGPHVPHEGYWPSSPRDDKHPSSDSEDARPIPTPPVSWGDPIQLDASGLLAAPVAERWLLRWPDGSGCLPRGTVGILASDGGLGKTRAVIELACVLASGGEWFGPTQQGRHVRTTAGGLRVDPEAKGGRTLLLLAEETERNVRRRLHYAVRDTGADPDEVARRVVALPLATATGLSLTATVAREFTRPTSAVQGLRELIERHGPFDLIVLDPLSAFSSTETEVSAEAATAMFAILASLTQGGDGPTVLVCHHTTKASNRERGHGAGALRGSSGINNRSRWTAVLERAVATVTDGGGKTKEGHPATFAVEKANDARRGFLALVEDTRARGRLHVAPPAAATQQGPYRDAADAVFEDRS